MNQNVLINN